MATSFYIDEAAGSDVTGQGTQQDPYQTLGFAVYSQPEGSFLIRKDSTVEYAEPTQSSLKKAKKTADGIEKKKKKQEEQEERDKKAKGEEKEKREKLLEESKKIVLEEDSWLPKAQKVKLILLPVLSDYLSPLRHSPRSAISRSTEVKEFAFAVGYIVCASRRILSLWSCGMEQATCRLSSLAKLHRHTLL